MRFYSSAVNHCSYMWQPHCTSFCLKWFVSVTRLVLFCLSYQSETPHCCQHATQVAEWFSVSDLLDSSPIITSRVYSPAPNWDKREGTREMFLFFLFFQLVVAAAARPLSDGVRLSDKVAPVILSLACKKKKTRANFWPCDKPPSTWIRHRWTLGITLHRLAAACSREPLINAAPLWLPNPWGPFAVSMPALGFLEGLLMVCCGWPNQAFHPNNQTILYFSLFI